MTVQQARISRDSQSQKRSCGPRATIREEEEEEEEEEEGRISRSQIKARNVEGETGAAHYRDTAVSHVDVRERAMTRYLQKNSSPPSSISPPEPQAVLGQLYAPPQWRVGLTLLPAATRTHPTSTPPLDPRHNLSNQSDEPSRTSVSQSESLQFN
ncbi:hypothetical protein NQZ68_022620 [Dissostichus eleginoides]|nr:hypothetical protein NQZ68_022620 [Dissostichus eleginoides]